MSSTTTLLVLMASLALVSMTINLSADEEPAKQAIFTGESWVSDFIPIEENYQFFFWLFKSRDKNKKAPLVLFLQGGPGTSGVEAALFESGPYRVNSDLTIRRIAHSLNNNSDVLYVDQPLGTGFSHCDKKERYPDSEEKVAKDLYSFLVGFLAKHTEYKKRPLYIVGQSFGGHFIPGAIPKIIEMKNPDLNIRGIGIGNPHINPIVQFPQYAEFAYKMGLINVVTYETVKASLKQCKYYLEQGVSYIGMIEFYCTGSYIAIVGNSPHYRFNPYNIRVPCPNAPYCYEFTPLVQFMNKTEVRDELKVGNLPWVITNIDIIMALRTDYWKDYSAGVTYFLEHDIPVVLYYGKNDFVCNYFGGIETIRSLKWSGAEKLLKKEYEKYMVDGKEVGEYKQHEKLTYIEINDAGHMAIMDNPRIGLEIVNRLIKS